MRTFKIVLVTWEDAKGMLTGGGWVPIGDAIEIGEIPYLAQTVGLLISSSKEAVVLCSSYHEGLVSDTQRIPRGMVRKMKVLGTTGAGE